MPFPENPFGFSPQTARLLDAAMTKLWLEQVTTGAVLSGASAAFCDSLRMKVDRLNQLGTRPSQKIPGSAEKAMSVHKFQVGQEVIYHPPRCYLGATLFTVLKTLPLEGLEFTYRIKSPQEDVERVAKESELTGSF